METAKMYFCRDYLFTSTTKFSNKVHVSFLAICKERQLGALESVTEILFCGVMQSLISQILAFLLAFQFYICIETIYSW
jgi:hypothetical protein